MPKITVQFMGQDVEIEVGSEQLLDMKRQASDNIEINMVDVIEALKQNREGITNSVIRQRSARISMNSVSSVMSKKDLGKMSFVSGYEVQFRQGVKATLKWLLGGCEGDIWEYGSDEYIKDMKKQYYGNVNGRWL